MCVCEDFIILLESFAPTSSIRLCATFAATKCLGSLHAVRPHLKGQACQSSNKRWSSKTPLPATSARIAAKKNSTPHSGKTLGHTSARHCLQVLRAEADAQASCGKAASSGNRVPQCPHVCPTCKDQVAGSILGKRVATQALQLPRAAATSLRVLEEPQCANVQHWYRQS